MKPIVTYEIQQVGLYLKDKIEVYNRPTLDTPKAVFDLFNQIDSFSRTVDYKETAYAIYLNAKMKVLSVCLIAEGSDSNVMIPPKQVLQGAILQNATSVILVHNHPSQNTAPSENDIAATKRMYQCLKLFDMELSDHVIITSNSYLSMAEENLIH